jgi:hypothetical protein
MRTASASTAIEAQLPLKKLGSIVEILVGPLAPPDAEAKVAEVLRQHGYPEDIPIRRSGILQGSFDAA